MKCSCWIKIRCLARGPSHASSLIYYLEKNGLSPHYSYRNNIVSFALSCEKISSYSTIIEEYCKDALYSIQAKCWKKGMFPEKLRSKIFVDMDKRIAIKLLPYKRGIKLKVIDLESIHESIIRKIVGEDANLEILGERAFVFERFSRLIVALSILELYTRELLKRV